MIEIDVLSELLTEKEKSNPDYIQQMTDHICNYLITDKDHLRKAYNYYNGVVDKDQYRAIEDKYNKLRNQLTAFSGLVNTQF